MRKLPRNHDVASHWTACSSSGRPQSVQALSRHARQSSVSMHAYRTYSATAPTKSPVHISLDPDLDDQQDSELLDLLIYTMSQSDGAHLKPGECSTSGRQFQRPSEKGKLTPAKLSLLSSVLRMPLPMVQDFVSVCPDLLIPEPQELAAHISHVSSELGLSHNAVISMLSHQPGLVLRAEPGELTRRIKDLATTINAATAEMMNATSNRDVVMKRNLPGSEGEKKEGLSEHRSSGEGRAWSPQGPRKPVGCLRSLSFEEVLNWAVHTPSILVRSPEAIQRRVQKLAALLGVAENPSAVAEAVAALPQLLTDSLSSLQARLQDISQVLRIPLSRVQSLALLEPPLLALGTRVFTNRLKVLQAILGKDFRHVVTLVLKHPQVLVTDMDRVQEVYTQLQKTLRVTPGVVYAMVCHNPRLLTKSLQSIALRAQVVLHAAQRCRCWESEWKSLNPALRADCLSATAVTYRRLEYLLHVDEASKVKLVDVLKMAKSDFCRRWPNFKLALSLAVEKYKASSLKLGQRKCIQDVEPSGMGSRLMDGTQHLKQNIALAAHPAGIRRPDPHQMPGLLSHDPGRILHQAAALQTNPSHHSCMSHSHLSLAHSCKDPADSLSVQEARNHKPPEPPKTLSSHQFRRLSIPSHTSTVSARVVSLDSSSLDMPSHHSVGRRGASTDTSTPQSFIYHATKANCAEPAFQSGQKSHSHNSSIPKLPTGLSPSSSLSTGLSSSSSLSTGLSSSSSLSAGLSSSSFTFSSHADGRGSESALASSSHHMCEHTVMPHSASSHHMCEHSVMPPSASAFSLPSGVCGAAAWAPWQARGDWKKRQPLRQPPRQPPRQHGRETKRVEEAASISREIRLGKHDSNRETKRVEKASISREARKGSLVTNLISDNICDRSDSCINSTHNREHHSATLMVSGLIAGNTTRVLSHKAVCEVTADDQLITPSPISRASHASGERPHAALEVTSSSQGLKNIGDQVSTDVPHTMPTGSTCFSSLQGSARTNGSRRSSRRSRMKV
ncbi:hypothetical protein CEUSTIGMA_g5536.t1 [Chlamydomonas eustigma]|uniref:Uncharacterized protein n=1 Tax=Chlamydomonas eustigma TaxID=1157962 RepID=A0A250X4T2_9CHLO|nr:hypothetical protein CEUSTIGMA_g5536.t1 [Chlamydomonas eustigma]|eukprot:GAX78094.1 hypothetical protein CEUSTIGMA_g5536.t1 [Chlamydomonas eustigma]